MKRSFALAILFVAVVAMTANAANITASTVAYWGFNEQAPGTQSVDGAVVVDSTGGNNGTIDWGIYKAGNPPVEPWLPIIPQYVNPSPYCNDPVAALHLNDAPFSWPEWWQEPEVWNHDKVVVAENTADFNLLLGDGQHDYTLEACVKIDPHPFVEMGEAYENNVGGVIMSKRKHVWGSGMGWVFRTKEGIPGVDENAGALDLYIQGSTSPTYNYFNPDATGTINVCDGQWHHVAAVIENDPDAMLTSVSFYVDNVLDRSVTFDSVIEQYTPGNHWVNENIVNDYDLWLGDLQGRWGDQLVGDVDSMSFSNAALAPGSFVLNCVPEPSSIVLLVMGALALLAVRRVR